MTRRIGRMISYLNSKLDENGDGLKVGRHLEKETATLDYPERAVTIDPRVKNINKKKPKQGKH